MQELPLRTPLFVDRGAEETKPLAHLYAHFDESGKHSDHAIVAMGGLVDGFDHWQAFQERWFRLLRETRLEGFHMAEAVRHSQHYGAMGPGTADKRTDDLRPFVQAITEELALGIAFAVDVKAYGSQQFSVLHQSLGPDPQTFLFFVVVNSILAYHEIPKQWTVGLIFDDEEKYAMDCYRILKKMKLVNPEVRRRVTSICFSDEGRTPAVQSSDVLAYLTRTEAERRFLNKPYPYEKLFSAFQSVSPGGGHLHWDSGFFDADELARYQNKFIDGLR